MQFKNSAFYYNKRLFDTIRSSSLLKIIFKFTKALQIFTINIKREERYDVYKVMEQRIFDTNAGKQLS
jgi:hypothetical protein